jgi:AcrR family transcriptional regulator
MKKGDARRQQILERLADYLLAEGLYGASLRPLAAAAGTSDRMLLHYFVDKEALLTATLTLVTQRLIAMLEQVRIEPLPLQSLLPHLAAMLTDERIRPYMRLWLELVTLAAAGKEPFRAIAQHICSTFVTWIAATLRVEREEDREPLAALTLAIVEGLVVFDALGNDAARAGALAGVTLGSVAAGRIISSSTTNATGS